MNRFTVPTLTRKSSDVTAIILASLPNQRMKTMPAVSLTMVDIEKNVLDLQVEAIRTNYPKADIILVTGHNSYQIIAKRPPSVRIVENQLYESNGEVDEIRLGLNNGITNTVILISGNTIFDSNCLSMLKGHGSCTIVSDEDEDDDSLGVISNNNIIENIAYGIPYKWSHITLLEEKELKLLQKFAKMKNKGNMCSFEAINYVVSNGGIIHTVHKKKGFLKRICGSKDIET